MVDMPMVDCEAIYIVSIVFNAIAPGLSMTLRVLNKKPISRETELNIGN